MNSKNFLIIALAIFLVKVVFLPAGKVWLNADLFACLVLTAVIIDKNFSEKVFLILVFSLIFDAFSGNTFGSASLALFFSTLVIFWSKKFILLSDKSFFVNFLWLLFFYFLYLFFLSGAESLFYFYLYDQAVLAFSNIFKVNFTSSNLVQTFLLFTVFIFLINRYVGEKKISNFKF
ncbi:MAG: hypothetical protein HYX21_00615 [Candidatus Yanofskybacteria bacterium]|nr:hypothetical protein [Candidatus Yanofskybacteria bacterium]